MVISAFPAVSSAPAEGSAGPRAVTNDANDLIIPEGEMLEMSGCHTYKKSILIMGVLNVMPYDGKDESTGTLTLKAPSIMVGSTGGIFGQGRGYGGGGGGTDYYSSVKGGLGGLDGKGGDGSQYYYTSSSGGGGGGSNGGRGGSGSYPGKDGTELGGGSGGGGSYAGGKGGAGFGAGGGGGGAQYSGGGGGGAGGTGGKDGNWYNGGDGAGPFFGKGANGLSWSTPGVDQYGRNGGYREAKANGDASTDLSVWRGSGGGGGATTDYYYGGGAGGGGAGGGAITLLADNDIKINGIISTSGSPGGLGGSNYYGAGGMGGGGAGGGIAVFGLKVIVTGLLSALGYENEKASVNNGGTVKILFGDVFQSNGDIQGGRVFINGRPRMKGLDTPLNNTQVVRKPMFKWYAAEDPEGDPITYELEVSSTQAFTSPRRKSNLATTNGSLDVPLSGTMYWRVRGVDQVGAGGWSEVRMFTVDDDSPTSKINPMPDFTTSQVFTVSWTGEDVAGGSGIAYYTVWVSDNGGVAYKWMDAYAGTSAAFAGAEGHTYRFWSLATDLADNTEVQTPESIVATTVDSVAPLASISAMPQYQSKANFLVSWVGRDTTSGVADYTIFVSVDGADFVPWLENTTELSAQYKGEESHRYTFVVLARDVAGNVQNVPGPEKYITTRVDGTPPATSFSPSSPIFGQNPTYIRQTATIYLNGTDNFAGVNRTFYVIDTRVQQEFNNGFRETQGGSHNITFWSMDEAGNEEAKRTTWFWVDGDAPSTALSFIGPNWTTETKVFISGQTNVAFFATDKGSGINRTIYNIDGSGKVVYSGPFKLPKAGLHSMKYNSADNLGQEDAEKNVSIVMDIWNPSSVALVDSTASGQDVVVELRGTDLESGLAGVYYRIIKKGEPGMSFVNGTQITIPAAFDHSLDGTYTIEYYAVDNVGNREDTRKLEIIIDTVGTLAVNIKGNPSVTDPLYVVSGTAEPGSIVTVNGLRVLVKPDGTFNYELELKAGKNKIVVVSTDKAGNSATVTKYATYTKPQETGMLVPIILVVIVIAVVAVLALLLMRRKPGPAVMPQREPSPAPVPMAPAPVPPAK